MNRILSIASVAAALISVLIVQYMGGAVQQVTVGIPSPLIALQTCVCWRRPWSCSWGPQGSLLFRVNPRL